VSTSTDRPPTLAREIGTRAAALERKLEDVVGEQLDHTLEQAEARIARTFGARAVATLRFGLRLAGWALLAAFFVFGLLFLALRYWLLPDIDAMRPRVEAIASSALNAPVTIGRIDASWRGLNPVLTLHDVRISGRGGGTLSFPRARGTLSWASVPALSPRFAFLRIDAPEIDVTLLPGGAFSLAGIVIDPSDAAGDSGVLDWLLTQKEIGVWDARVRLRDARAAAADEVVFSDVDLLLQGGLTGNRFSVQLAPPAELAAPIDVRGDFNVPPFGRRSDFMQWRGELFAQVDYVDLAALNRWVHAPFAVKDARGALRAWLSVDAGDVVGVTADLALEDVDARLGADLQPLRMRSLEGRVTQARWGDAARGGQLVGLAGVTFTLASGAQFPPLDLTYRTTRPTAAAPQVSEIDGSRIDLTSLASIATHVPLGAELRRAIERFAPQGELADVSMRWEGDEPRWRTLTARARFDRLSLAAQPAADGVAAGLPGFERLAGSVQLDRGSGNLRLASRNVALVFPGVFQTARLPFGEFGAEVHWRTGERVEARIDALRLANEDLELSATGTWRAPADGGPGTADLTGRIERLDARHAYRYVPLVAGSDTVRWLQGAIVDGRVENGSFRLRGDLTKFPFAAPADGEFRVAARLRDGVLDVGPDRSPGGNRGPGAVWPLIRGIDAELVFERQGMTVRAQRATTNDVRLSDTVATIPDLGHDATLALTGQASGALADIVGYINASPVAGWIGGITRGAEARGNARLDLKLDLPLLRADATRVTGALQFSGNDVTLPNVPPFTRASGTLNFNERGIRFNDIAAGFLGGQARLDASTRADGAIVVSGSGTATPTGLRRAVDVDTVHRVLDRAQGTLRYTASVTAQSAGVAIAADSDLVGIALDGLPPLRKSAAEALPLRYEQTMRGAERRLRVTAGRALGVQLEHRRDGDALRFTRGVVALGENAQMPESGLTVMANMPRIDVTAWAQWLGIELDARPRSPAAPHEDDIHVDRLALRTSELVVERRSFRNVTLGATRTAVGGYDANVVSDGVVGAIAWRPGSPGAATMGTVTARLTKLIIPTGKKDEVVGALQAPARQLPGFDVTVDDFELGPTKYGRLEINAAHSVTPSGTAWRLNRLEITNADMKASATGDWQPAAAGVRRMRLDFTLDTSDAGATLARFGVPGAVANGRGQLDGKLDWAGSPFDIDFATLGGTLSLRVENGRFLKVDTRGAGRLLTLLSLQSLSRTLFADTRERFGEGFAFNVIKGDGTVARGVLSTENFSMTGAGAAAFMSGTIDLARETQSLHLLVVPELDASTAAIALGIANPIVGLGALLANTVLKAPISRAFALDYDITGTWNDPVITRRARETASAPTETAR
jgi:uncharacterized protein (TIGR02099 family)